VGFGSAAARLPLLRFAGVDEIAKAGAGLPHFEAVSAVVVPENDAVVFGATFILAPFQGNKRGAGRLAEIELRRGFGFADIEPIGGGQQLRWISFWKRTKIASGPRLRVPQGGMRSRQSKDGNDAHGSKRVCAQPL